MGTKALILDEATGRNRPVVGVTGAITIDHVISDNLSDLNADLSARLREVEVEFEAVGQAGIRDELLNAITGWRRSTFRVGSTLARYKEIFKNKRGWIKAAITIADNLGVVERTIHRWVSDYESVASVPGSAIAALEDEGIDPAAPKNKALVDNVVQMLPRDSEPTSEEAKEAVAKAKTAVEAARSRRPAPKPKSRIDQAVDYLNVLFRGVDPETRKAEIETVMQRLHERLDSPKQLPTITSSTSGKTGLIYEPAGRAREYAALALNVYAGCDHQCSYCYAPSATFKKRDAFCSPTLRSGDFLTKLEKEAASLSPSDPILLSFTTDPYQKLDVTEQVTRKAIQILHRHGHKVHILTKGGSRALRDRDLLTPGDAFGSTLTFLDAATSATWEPGAASPEDRIATLKVFHDAGIPTWASLEPVIDPDTALEIIRRTHAFVNLFKVGRWNYDKRANEIDWRKFAQDAVRLLESLGAKYLLKQDLKKFLGEAN